MTRRRRDWREGRDAGRWQSWEQAGGDGKSRAFEAGFRAGQRERENACFAMDNGDFWEWEA